MAVKPQANCYPSQGLVTQNKDAQPVCTGCNVNNPYSNSSCSGSNNYAACSSYCNSSCNTVCNTVQAYCSIGYQYIRNHGDVGAHPSIACVARDELIFRNWTAAYWNSLIDKLDTAEMVGKTKNQGWSVTAEVAVADPCNDAHPAGSLVTAGKYNQVATKINHFNQATPMVSVGDVIKGLHALALRTNYNNATFFTNVCDVCNTSGQTSPKCDCNCPCPCNCSCPCSCSCNCGCGCSYGT